MPSTSVIAPRDDLGLPGKLVVLADDAFLTFATTCHSAEGIMAFANAYGVLGGLPVRDFGLVLVDGEDLGPGIYEAVEDWQRHAAVLKWHWDYWNVVRVGNPYKELAAGSLDLLRRAPVLLEPTPGAPLPPAGESEPPQPGDWPTALLVGREGPDVVALHHEWQMATSVATRRRRLRRLAWTLLGLSVTAHLRMLGVVPALMPVATVDLKREKPLPGIPMGLMFAASNLIGSLWLQFALAISRRVTYRPCPGCGKHLTIHPDAYRTNRRTCSDRCRSKVYRDSKTGTVGQISG